MVFDVIILAILAIFTVIGYFKGFLNQFFSFLGIILAYFMSAKYSHYLEGPMRDLLPFSNIISDMFARFSIGIVIFLIVKLSGKFFEFMFTSKVKEFSSFNHWGGFFFGLLKSVLVIFLVMVFVTLIPSKFLKKRSPAIYRSTVYRLCNKYNPVIKPLVMDNLRKVKDVAQNSKRLKIITNSAVYKDYLKTKNIENPFADSEVMKFIKEGNVEGLKKKGYFKLLEDKDFMDFIDGEKYYKQPEKAMESVSP